MILMEDLGWNDTSYHGSDILTPTIDKLAGEGIKIIYKIKSYKIIYKMQSYWNYGTHKLYYM